MTRKGRVMPPACLLKDCRKAQHESQPLFLRKLLQYILSILSFFLMLFKGVFQNGTWEFSQSFRRSFVGCDGAAGGLLLSGGRKGCLNVDHIPQHIFLRSIADVAHLLNPAPLIVGLGVDLIVRPKGALPDHPVELGGELLFQIRPAHPAVFAEGRVVLIGYF